MTVAVISNDGTEPAATFVDMPTALAWGLQQYKGRPFVVRVFSEEGQVFDPVPLAASPRRPAARTAEVANVLRVARRAADQEDFRIATGSFKSAVAH